MVKKELISRVVTLLRENNMKKSVSVPKRVFHISDDDGNSRDFQVKETNKNVVYTSDDVLAIIDACICVVLDTIKRGEEISIHGFGKLGLKYRQPRELKNVLDGEKCFAPGGYVPRFVFGNELARCAKMYTQAMADKEINKVPVILDEEEFE